MNHHEIKCFEYSRKSSEGEDRQVQSIERQEEENQMTIQRYGLNVIDRFSESRSAKIPKNRPVFDTMLKRIKKGEAQGIVCWHLNRLARNPEEAGKIQQMLTDGIIKAIYTRDRLYLPSDNLLLFSVESGMSAQYSIDLSKAIRSGNEKKIRNGIAPTLAPIGYLNTKYGKSGSNFITVDPDRFHIVKRMWDYMLTGSYLPSEILRKANEEWGLRTVRHKVRGGVPLSSSLLYRMFSDPFYTGHFIYKGVTHKGVHEPMITLEQFDKVQFLLGRGNNPRPVKHLFSYTGIMKCAGCGCAITATKKEKFIKGEGIERTYIFYHCTRKRNQTVKCNQTKGIKEAELEKTFMNELEKLSISPLLHQWVLTYLRSSYSTIIEQEEAIKASQIQEVSKLETEIKNLLSLRLNEAISDAEYKNERTLREARILRLKETIELTSNGTRSKAANLENRFTFLRNLAQRFNESTVEKKKRIILEIGSNYKVKDQKLLFTKPDWLVPVTELKDVIEAKINRLEPEKALTEQQKKEVFGLLSPFCGV